MKLISKFSGLNKRNCRRPNIKNNIWLIPFLCQFNNISQSNCSKSLLQIFQINYRCFHDIFPPSVIDIWSFAENVVLTLAHALDNLISSPAKKTFDYAGLLDSIRSVRFKDLSHRNYIGPPVVNYTVVNLKSVEGQGGRLKFVRVGSWTKDLSKVKQKRRLFLYKSSIQWNTGTFLFYFISFFTIFISTIAGYLIRKSSLEDNSDTI